MPHEVKTDLLASIRRYGAFDINACYNCGNCTAVCPLAEQTMGFPCRLIRVGQVGMEKYLLADEHLWLCYGCGQCTETCPRQADPAQYMAAARRYAAVRYDPTGLARLALGSPLGQTLLFAAFSTMFAILLLWHKGDMNGQQLAFFNFIPGAWIHDIGVALFVLVGFAAVAGVASMLVRFVVRHAADRETPLVWSRLPRAVPFALIDALAHVRYRRCDEEPVSPVPLWFRPWFIHAMILWGFLGMLAATTLDLLLKPIGSFVPLWYPVRLLGIAASLACLYGLASAMARRWRAAQAPYNASRFADWFFLLLLATTVLTGVATTVVVYLPQPSSAAYVRFLVHTVLAMDLIVMLPLTKFAHALYRPLAVALHYWSAASAAVPAVAASEV